jgi:uncharacterized protein
VSLRDRFGGALGDALGYRTPSETIGSSVGLKRPEPAGLRRRARRRGLGRQDDAVHGRLALPSGRLILWALSRLRRRLTLCPVGFEWDVRKARDNVTKHRVSFEEAMTVFGDSLGRILEDPHHSVSEQRFVIIGESVRRRLLVVLFTERGDAIRLVGARRATRRERRSYEEGEP